MADIVCHWFTQMQCNDLQMLHDKENKTIQASMETSNLTSSFCKTFQIQYVSY